MNMAKHSQRGCRMIRSPWQYSRAAFMTGSSGNEAQICASGLVSRPFDHKPATKYPATKHTASAAKTPNLDILGSPFRAGGSRSGLQPAPFLSQLCGYPCLRLPSTHHCIRSGLPRQRRCAADGAGVAYDHTAGCSSLRGPVPAQRPAKAPITAFAQRGAPRAGMRNVEGGKALVPNAGHPCEKECTT